MQRSSARYQRQLRRDESKTVALIRTYVEEQPMYGYRMIAAMLKQDGHAINGKRVYRIWRQEGLQLPRRRTTKRRYGDSTGQFQRATRPNEVWSYDFLASRTERGGKLRMLTILDEYTRESLAIHVAQSISSHQVIRLLEWLFLVRGAPPDLLIQLRLLFFVCLLFFRTLVGKHSRQIGKQLFLPLQQLGGMDPGFTGDFVERALPFHHFQGKLIDKSLKLHTFGEDFLPRITGSIVCSLNVLSISFEFAAVSFAFAFHGGLLYVLYLLCHHLKYLSKSWGSL